jgi:hypothetical protein
MAKFSNNSYSETQCKFVIESDIGNDLGDFSMFAGTPNLESALSILELISNHWSNCLKSKRPLYRIVKTSNSEIIKTTEQ